MTGSKVPSRWYELQISCLTLRRERVDERRCIIRVRPTGVIVYVSRCLGRHYVSDPVITPRKISVDAERRFLGQNNKGLSMRTPLLRCMRVSSLQVSPTGLPDKYSKIFSSPDLDVCVGLLYFHEIKHERFKKTFRKSDYFLINN